MSEHGCAVCQQADRFARTGELAENARQVLAAKVGTVLTEQDVEDLLHHITEVERDALRGWLSVEELDDELDAYRRADTKEME